MAKKNDGEENGGEENGGTEEDSWTDIREEGGRAAARDFDTRAEERRLREAAG